MDSKEPARLCHMDSRLRELRLRGDHVSFADIRVIISAMRDGSILQKPEPIHRKVVRIEWGREPDYLCHIDPTSVLEFSKIELNYGSA